jgi:hypothetical protein
MNDSLRSVLKKLRLSGLLEGLEVPGSEHHGNLLMGRRKVVNGPSFW